MNQPNRQIKEEGIFPKEMRNIRDLTGLFETVDTVPTNIPKNMFEQIKVYENAGVKKLYVYYQHSSTNKGWIVFTGA